MGALKKENVLAFMFWSIVLLLLRLLFRFLNLLLSPGLLRADFVCWSETFQVTPFIQEEYCCPMIIKLAAYHAFIASYEFQVCNSAI